MGCRSVAPGWGAHHNIATANVITKSIETGRFAANEFVELVGFLNTAIRDFDRQLHTPV